MYVLMYEVYKGLTYKGLASLVFESKKQAKNYNRKNLSGRGIIKKLETFKRVYGCDFYTYMITYKKREGKKMTKVYLEGLK